MGSSTCTAKNKLLSMGLSVLLVFGLMPSAAYAGDSQTDVVNDVATLQDTQDGVAIAPVINDEYNPLEEPLLEDEQEEAMLEELQLEEVESEDVRLEDDAEESESESSDVKVQSADALEVVADEGELEVVDDADAQDNDVDDIAVETQSNYIGSSFSTAYDLTQNSFFGYYENGKYYNYKYWDHLTKSHTEGYIKFNLSKAGCVTFKVQSPQPAGEGVGVPVTVAVYGAASTSSKLGSTVLNPNSMKAISGSWSIHLTAGTYYVSMSVSSSNAPSSGGLVELYPSFAAANESFAESQGGSNNSIGSASGPLAFNKTYTGQLTVNDKEDYYKFTLSSAGRVSMKFGNLSNLSLDLFDRVQNSADTWHKAWGHLAQSMHRIEGTSTYYSDLSAGTYYLKVTRSNYTWGGTYTLALSFSKAAESFPEKSQYSSDNSVHSASSVAFGKTYYGQLSATDYEDYYTLYVGANRNISLAITSKTSYTGNAYVVLCDEYGDFSSGIQYLDTYTNITVPQSYRTYYLRIYTDWHHDTGAYSFRFHNGVMEDIKYVSIGSIDYKHYTGKAIKPKPKLTYQGRKLKNGTDYTLSYTNNKKPGTATVTVTGKNGFYGTRKVTFTIIKASVKYATYVWGSGYKQGWKKNGAVSGKKKKSIQYFKAQLGGKRPDGGIEYYTNSIYAGSGKGWDTGWYQYWVSNGSEAGGGNSKDQIETIRIQLYGEIKHYYNVYYRVRTKGYGWMGWTKNGKKAGTENMHKRIDGIQVVLVKKGGKAPGAKYKGVKRQTKAAYKHK